MIARGPTRPWIVVQRPHHSGILLVFAFPIDVSYSARDFDLAILRAAATTQTQLEVRQYELTAWAVRQLTVSVVSIRKNIQTNGCNA